MEQNKILLNNRIANSFKWSTITEVITKLVTPILNIILAHILLPEEFAPLTMVNMVITFSEIFVEYGFRKYLIQHSFKDENDYEIHFLSALWANLFVAFFIWAIISIFSPQLCAFLGNKSLWLCLILSGSIIPLYSICGLLNSRLQKELKFKKLFFARISTVVIPLFVTIPLALFGLSYWSLIIGNILSVFAQALVLVIVSKIRIRFVLSPSCIKKMFNAATWTLLDGLFIWATSWAELFIIGKYMSDYYLGLYNNSISIVNSLSGIITASVTPVLFVGLSKLKDDDYGFTNLFHKVQRAVMLFFIPMGLGCFVYSEFIVTTLLGNEWIEASAIIGVTAISSFIRTIYIGLCSDAFRAKGHFRIPFILQFCDLCVIIPCCYLASKHGFWQLVYIRALIRIDLIIPDFILMKKVLNVGFKEQFFHSIPIYLSAFAMFLVCLFLHNAHPGRLASIFGIVVGVVVYFGLISLFPTSRKDLFENPLSQKVITGFKKVFKKKNVADANN